MKTVIVTFACLLLFVCVVPVQATTYKSDVGYSITGKIPQSSEGVKELCNSLPGELSKATGREITVDHCESRTVANRPSLDLHADDYWKGRKYIQYQIQTQKGEILFFTANSNQRDFINMKEEFEQAMDSLKFDAITNP